MGKERHSQSKTLLFVRKLWHRFCSAEEAFAIHTFGDILPNEDVS